MKRLMPFVLIGMMLMPIAATSADRSSTGVTVSENTVSVYAKGPDKNSTTRATTTTTLTTASDDTATDYSVTMPLNPGDNPTRVLVYPPINAAMPVAAVNNPNTAVTSSSDSVTYIEKGSGTPVRAASGQVVETVVMPSGTAKQQQLLDADKAGKMWAPSANQRVSTVNGQTYIPITPGQALPNGIIVVPNNQLINNPGYLNPKPVIVINQQQEPKKPAYKKPLTSKEKPQLAASHKTKVLVAYFSRGGEAYDIGYVSKGSTAIVADMIASWVGADRYQIKPTVPYPELLSAAQQAAKIEKNGKLHPALRDPQPNIGPYEVIFLGYPIWYKDMPMIVYSFLEQNHFEGKIIVPFCTHEGTGLGKTVKAIEKAAPGAKVLPGLAIRGTDAQHNKEMVRGIVGGLIRSAGL